MKKVYAFIDNGCYENCEELLGYATNLENCGIDGIVLSNVSDSEESCERFLNEARAMSKVIDIPFIIGTAAKRFEDVKKAFYTGAAGVVLKASTDESIIREGAERFGKANIYVTQKDRSINTLGEYFIQVSGCKPQQTSKSVGTLKDELEEFDGSDEKLLGIVLPMASERLKDILGLKRELKGLGIDVNTFSTDISFDELKKDSAGLVPCIVQDYKNGEVLMLAYMDREAFERTVATGIMTYHSRSRNELWIKGATSGHYQYLKNLRLDCDSDTLLAKVAQVGAACHTGSRSCFFNELIAHEYGSKDISKVLNSLYEVVVDRKANPKEGSYTNYLFNKGIDKILKKCGEEATEMVIAAKNPDAEELKYEIADLLYHMTVLMVECGVDWRDVATELANR